MDKGPHGGRGGWNCLLIGLGGRKDKPEATSELLKN